jgi:hypothetical protein
LTHTFEQWFSVTIEASDGWETSQEVSNEVIGEMAIDYDFLPIRCRFCLKVSHHIKDSPTLVESKDS